MQKLARYIDRKMTQIKTASPGASINDKVKTVFIALNIADDFYKIKENNEWLENELDKYIFELGRMQEENMMLTDKIKELQDQLNQSKKELDEYIQNFDIDNVVSFHKV
jgi:cell division protein ZapA (FtsZ GTPase activity inhibitor)